MAKSEVPKRLEDHRASLLRVKVVSTAYIDLAVSSVGHRSNRCGDVRGSDHLETEVISQQVEITFGHRAVARIADGLDYGASELLDVGKVVAAFRHLSAKLGIRRSCLVPGERCGIVAAP